MFNGLNKEHNPSPNYLTSFYKQSEKEIFFENLIKNQFLSESLEGINFHFMNEDEFDILLIWTSPLVTSNIIANL